MNRAIIYSFELQDNKLNLLNRLFYHTIDRDYYEFILNFKIDSLNSFPPTDIADYYYIPNFTKEKTQSIYSLQELQKILKTVLESKELIENLLKIKYLNKTTYFADREEFFELPIPFSLSFILSTTESLISLVNYCIENNHCLCFSAD